MSCLIRTCCSVQCLGYALSSLSLSCQGSDIRLMGRIHAISPCATCGLTYHVQ